MMLVCSLGVLFLSFLYPHFPESLLTFLLCARNKHTIIKQLIAPPGLELGWMAHPQEVGLVLQGWFLTFISGSSCLGWEVWVGHADE